MARYTRDNVENRIETARSAVNALSAFYRAGSKVNGVSHMAVFECRNKQVTIRAATRGQLMDKLDAFIDGAYAALNG